MVVSMMRGDANIHMESTAGGPGAQQTYREQGRKEFGGEAGVYHILLAVECI